MATRTWLRKLLGPTLYLNGTQVSPDAADWNLLDGYGVALSVSSNASTGRTDITVARVPLTPSTPAELTTNTDDYVLPDADLIRISASGAINVTGLVADAVPRVRRLLNVGANTITLKHNDAGSAAANRFAFPGSADVSLIANKMVAVLYDTTTALWYVQSV